MSYSKNTILYQQKQDVKFHICAIAEVQRNTHTSITTSDNYYHRLDFQSLMVDASLRIVSPDVQQIGIWEARKLAGLADPHYVNRAWHDISSPIRMMAGVHLAAATPNFMALEHHAAKVPFFEQLRRDGDRSLIRDWRVQVPKEPGLGIDLNEDITYRYRKRGEPFFGDPAGD